MTADVAQRPLPTTANFNDHNQTSAYTIIRRAEEEAQNPQHLMFARVVGFMLLEFHKRVHIFSGLPCSALANLVTSPTREKGSNDLDVVYALGELLREKFIRLFRTSTPPYQPPCSPSSRPAFDTVEDMIRDILEPTDQRQTSSRQKALARDGFRCMITGFFDKTSVRNCPSLLNQAPHKGRGTMKVDMEAAHILNESAVYRMEPEGAAEISIQNKAECVAVVVAMLEALGFSDFTERFKHSGGLQQVWNLLSLEYNLCRTFEVLELWFEHTEKPGCYKICVSDEGTEKFIRCNFQHLEPHVDGTPMVVEFTSQFENAPPPDPVLLALHATCARVAHMSGAAEYFDKLEMDQDIDFLARDGSNAALLSHLLSPFGALEAECY